MTNSLRVEKKIYQCLKTLIVAIAVILVIQVLLTIANSESNIQYTSHLQANVDLGQCCLVMYLSITNISNNPHYPLICYEAVHKPHCAISCESLTEIEQPSKPFSKSISMKSIFFIWWPWSLTYDPDLQGQPKYHPGVPSCQILWS